MTCLCRLSLQRFKKQVNRPYTPPASTMSHSGELQENSYAKAQYQESLREGLTEALRETLKKWNDSHVFCGRCGNRTRGVDPGKRVCLGEAEHKSYASPTPVVMMHVESCDGTCTLVVRAANSKWPPGVLTCITGFVEQGESAGQAGMREVLEEAGVHVIPASIRVVHTQPWLQGWGGSCELIIGCTAKAVNDKLHPDQEEMAEVKWVHRSELSNCVAHADWVKPSSNSEGTSGFKLPPRDTLGYQLLSEWGLRPASLEE